MAPNTAVRGPTGADVSFVHTNTVARQAHPVGHRSTTEFSAFRHLVLTGICIAFDFFACGIVDGAIEVRALVLELFSDEKLPGRSVIFVSVARGDSIVHRDFLSDHKKPALIGNVDLNVGV